MHDLVIRSGNVVDGSGKPSRTADVGVSEGRIVEIGGDIASGKREIDAAGLLVTPGWVDVHSHYDGQALWDPLLETSAMHGVTTVVMGNCGVGFAPVRAADRAWTVALMEGVEDIPAAVLEEGLAWEWESFPEYLDALDNTPHAISVGTQVPHAPLRVFAMGERGIDHEHRPTEQEIRAMGELVAEAIDAGALGFTTSRSKNHKSSDGRITPSYSAGEAELVGIAEAMGRTGKGVLEMNVENTDVDGELALMRRLCAVSRRPLSAALLQRPGQPTDNYRRVLGGFEAAAQDGLSLWGQVAPRPTGLLISLQAAVNPLRASSTFRDLAARQGSGLLPSTLQRAELREKILSELPDGSGIISRFPYAFEVLDPPRHDQDPSESLTHRAAAVGALVDELVYDILARGGMIYVPVSNYVEGNLRATREMLLHPRTIPGLSDGGAHCSMVADFDYPTFLLSYWGRDAPEDARLPVEWVIRRQCADTSRLVGLDDRGVLSPGKRADINLIDLSRVGTSPPRIVDDLPGGGTRLLSRGTGYVATIVGGHVAFENGAHTGAMAGELVRG